MGRSKSKTFKAGIHTETIFVIILPMIVAGVLFWYGVRNNELFPPEGDPFWRNIFVYGPVALGVIIIIISTATLISNLMIRITVTPEKIYFKQGRKEFECNWRVLSFSPPPKGKKFLRVFTISDGQEIAWVNSAFFPKFDILVELIKTAKSKAIDSGYQV